MAGNDKKEVYLFEANFQQGPKECNAYFLPYASGALWSYAQTSDIVKESFELQDIIFRREDAATIFDKIQNPAVLGFSCYVWSWSYNLHFAKLLKERFPNAVVVFGGPQVPESDPDFFEKFPFVDYCLHKEGEISFQRLLENLAEGTDNINLPGVSHKHQPMNSAGAPRVSDLTVLPSPYTLGLFDKLVAENPDIEWNAIIETSRGCPYRCTFCDWGSLTYSKTFMFPEERVRGDIDWIFENSCGAIMLADANFGLFGERDEKIIDYIAQLQKEKGRPYMVSLNWAKNQNKRVLGMSKKLSVSGLNNGLTLSMQSMSPEVLQQIKRKNMDLNKVDAILDQCNTHQHPNYTELILGLPGETLSSWKQGLFRLLELDQHSGIEIFFAQLLENSELNKSRDKYGIRSAKLFGYLPGVSKDPSIEESVDIVIGTNTLPFADFLDALRFNWLILNFHSSGWSQILARVAVKTGKYTYDSFYNALLEKIEHGTDKWLCESREQIISCFESWFKLGRLPVSDWQGAKIHGWNLLLLSSIQFYKAPEQIWHFLSEFWLEMDIDQEVLADAMEFQKNFMVQFGGQYPRVQNFHFNWNEHLFAKEELQQVSHDYAFAFSEQTDDFGTFASRLYFGRRRNFGQTKVSSSDRI